MNCYDDAGVITLRGGMTQLHSHMHTTKRYELHSFNPSILGPGAAPKPTPHFRDSRQVGPVTSRGANINGDKHTRVA